MTPDELRSRTAAFSRDVARLVGPLFSRPETLETADQLSRAAGSAASNYRSACRARSHAEFTARIGVAVNEADESLHWLEHARDCGFLDGERLEALLIEADELTRILGKSHATAKRRDEADQARRRARRGHRRRHKA